MEAPAPVPPAPTRTARRRRFLTALAVVGAAAVAAAPVVASAPPAAAAPVAATSRGHLQAVDCLSATDCWAVGFNLVGPPYGGVILHWDGRAWGYVPAPYPVGSRDSSLGSLSCFSAVDCVAFGHYGATTAEASSYVERWNGRSWRLTRTPQVSGYRAGSTTCVGPSDCLAVAEPVGGGPAQRIERWRGAAWHLVSAVTAPGGGPVALSSLSCVRSSCTVVGAATAAVPGPSTLVVEHGDGVHWTARVTPAAVGPTGSELAAVSCPTTAACLAVGSRAGAGEPVGAPLAESGAGARWRVAVPPSPARGGVAAFAGVVCRTATSCQAWGVDGRVGRIEGWNGTRWRAEALPAPLRRFTPTGVDCASAVSCVAVGYDGAGTGATLAAAVWNGSAWSATAVP